MSPKVDIAFWVEWLLFN